MPTLLPNPPPMSGLTILILCSGSPATIAYNVRTKGRTLLKQQAVFGYTSSEYESSRIWVTARDGVKVPVALVYKKGVKLDGSTPLLLYAYGSYGASLDPTFSSGRLSSTTLASVDLTSATT